MKQANAMSFVGLFLIKVVWVKELRESSNLKSLSGNVDRQLICGWSVWNLTLILRTNEASRLSKSPLMCQLDTQPDHRYVSNSFLYDWGFSFRLVVYHTMLQGSMWKQAWRPEQESDPLLSYESAQITFWCLCTPLSLFRSIGQSHSITRFGTGGK